MLTRRNHQRVGCFSRDGVDLHVATHTASQHISAQKKPPGRVQPICRANWPTWDSSASSGLINASYSTGH